MAASRIKKKKSKGKVSPMPRQNAIPCVVIVVLGLIILGALFFAAIQTL